MVVQTNEGDEGVKVLGDDGLIYWVPRPVRAPSGNPSGSQGKYFRYQESSACGGNMSGSNDRRYVKGHNRYPGPMSRENKEMAELKVLVSNYRVRLEI